ncbi:hypothetical protein [Prevotella sp. KH2C16]|uniref:hypothetical protein n=1 Tax=Prevotella sp. KH2C16 TaxID=1855325 RepID=UPI000B873336|nr:hypothetical protein [Prevotella sp. KH2C16]
MKRIAAILTVCLSLMLSTGCIAQQKNGLPKAAEHKSIYLPMKTLYDTLPSCKLPLSYPGTVTGMKPVRKDQLDKDQMLPPDSTHSLPLRLFGEDWNHLEDLTACRLTDKTGARLILLKANARRFPEDSKGIEHFYLLSLGGDWRVKDCREVYTAYVHCGKSRPPMYAKQEFSIGTDRVCTVNTTYYNFDTHAMVHKVSTVLHVDGEGSFSEEKRTTLY